MRVTIPHTFDFRDHREVIGDDLIQPLAWDAARNTSGPFGLPESRQEWERMARQPQLQERAADIVVIAQRLGAHSLCSYGAGTGSLELNIHWLAPDVGLTCTDYAPRTTERLRNMFVEAEVVVHDLANEPPPSADLHLMHRIDTELRTETWMRVFERFTQPILLVPTLLLDVERMLKEVALRIVRPRASRAGWYRTEDALRGLWERTHSDEVVSIGDQRSFLLFRRTA